MIFVCSGAPPPPGLEVMAGQAAGAASSSAGAGASAGKYAHIETINRWTTRQSVKHSSHSLCIRFIHPSGAAAGAAASSAAATASAAAAGATAATATTQVVTVVAVTSGMNFMVGDFETKDRFVF